MRDRIAARLGLERATRLDLEHVEGRPCERCRDAPRVLVVAEADPDLADAGGARPLRVQRRGQGVHVTDDPRAVDAGEALDRRRDADRDPGTADLERQQPVRARSAREARCREHWHRLRVGGLLRPHAGRLDVRQCVVDPLAVPRRTAEADPTVECARERLERDPNAPLDRLTGVRSPFLQPCHGLELERHEPPAASVAGQRRLSNVTRPLELEATEAPTRGLKLRDHADVVAALDACDEPLEAGGQLRTEERVVALDPRRERGRRVAEVVAPAGEPRQRPGWKAEHRDSALPLQPADAAREPQHRIDLDATDGPEPIERGGVENRDQPRQVLTDEEVARHGVGGLVSLALRERRPIALREECERRS